MPFAKLLGKTALVCWSSAVAMQSECCSLEPARQLVALLQRTQNAAQNQAAEAQPDLTLHLHQLSGNETDITVPGDETDKELVGRILDALNVNGLHDMKIVVGGSEAISLYEARKAGGTTLVDRLRAEGGLQRETTSNIVVSGKHPDVLDLLAATHDLYVGISNDATAEEARARSEAMYKSWCEQWGWIIVHQHSYNTETSIIHLDIPCDGFTTDNIRQLFPSDIENHESRAGPLDMGRVWPEQRRTLRERMRSYRKPDDPWIMWPSFAELVGAHHNDQLCHLELLVGWYTDGNPRTIPFVHMALKKYRNQDEFTKGWWCTLVDSNPLE